LSSGPEAGKLHRRGGLLSPVRHDTSCNAERHAECKALSYVMGAGADRNAYGSADRDERAQTRRLTAAILLSQISQPIPLPAPYSLRLKRFRRPSSPQSDIMPISKNERKGESWQGTLS